MKHTLIGVLVLLLLAGSVRAEMPEPEPPPVDRMPAGDPSVTFPTPEPAPEPTPEPPPEPTPEPESAPQPTLEPGPADLSVRVCIDLDADHACGSTEGIHGLPVLLFDAATGDALAVGKTNELGTFRSPVHIEGGMDVAAAAPALGLTSQVWDPRRGVVLVLADVPIIPTRLP